MTYRQIHPRDNVAVLLRAEGDIPAGHKIALRPIAAGENAVVVAQESVKLIVERKPSC